MLTGRRNLRQRILGILLLSTFLLVFLLPTEVQAHNEIESIQIVAKLQENGSVIIRDHRVFYADVGTEHYISLGNLGDSDLLSFVVYDENDAALDYEDDWDLDASFSEKAGKYGVNYSGDELELCFGLGAYGRREFTIEYELSNFIFNLADDNQAFYWQFINPDMEPIANIEIRVKNDISYEYEYPESRLWGFGHEGGNTEILKDALTFTSGDYFDQSDYVVLLGVFEGTPFLTDYSLDITSEDLIDMALDKVSPDDEGGSWVDDEKGPFIDHEEEYYASDSKGVFRPFLLPLLFMIFPILIVLGVSAKGRKYERFNPTVKDQYYREVPYDQHFIDTQYFAAAEVSDWIAAFILKWISEGRLTEQVDQVGLIFKRDKLALKIMPVLPQIENALESSLWQMVVAAAGDDRVLAEKEFNAYVKGNFDSFNSWTEDVQEQSRTAMTQAGFLEKSTEKVFKVFTRTRFFITPKGQDLGDKITAFKNYLQDFSLLEERVVSHVVLWQELMIWAAFMGIAKEVYEQLKIANPQIEYEMPYSARTIIMTHAFASAIQSTQENAGSASSFSGGGGGSFSGGGGGSFGGGSGGGSR